MSFDCAVSYIYICIAVFAIFKTKIVNCHGNHFADLLNKLNVMTLNKFWKLNLIFLAFYFTVYNVFFCLYLYTR